jgi:hypothetical protein
MVEVAEDEEGQETEEGDLEGRHVAGEELLAQGADGGGTVLVPPVGVTLACLLAI